MIRTYRTARKMVSLEVRGPRVIVRTARGKASPRRMIRTFRNRYTLRRYLAAKIDATLAAGYQAAR